MRRAKLAAFALLPAAALLLLGEAGVRVYYAAAYDPRYLIAPFGRTLPAPVEYPWLARKTYTRRDVCTGREIVFTVNEAGGRGPMWTEERPAGGWRLLAVGESSTYGVNNPDDATWPALLQRALAARQPRPVEVLNGGRAGAALPLLTELLELWLKRLRPDVVLYYGGYNDANPAAAALSDTARGEWRDRLFAALQGRSLLYTYLVEKAQFRRAAAAAEVPADPAAHLRQLGRTFDLVAAQGAVPVLVLQATRLAWPAGRPAAARDLWQQRLAASSSSAERLEVTRAYNTHLFAEGAGALARSRGVAVIDPRPALAATAFCDEIHLRDEGNGTLAREIAAALAPSPPP